MDKKLRSKLFLIIEPAIFNNTNNYYLDKALEALQQLMLEQKLADATELKKYYTQLISEAEIKAKIDQTKHLQGAQEKFGRIDFKAALYELEPRDRFTALKQGKGK